VARLSGVARALVLDAEGLVKVAGGDNVARSLFQDAREANGVIVTAASTLTEVLRGGPRDAPVHRILKSVKVEPIDTARARFAGELLGRTGLSGHSCALDAILAAVALAQPRPVVILTSDPKDLARLTEEPDRPGRERVAVIAI
jgi:predicted nucleic acid-binding protein